MTPEALFEFLKEEQKEVTKIEECKEIVKNIETSEDKSSFTKEGFTHFLIFNDWQVRMVNTVASALYPKYNSLPGTSVPNLKKQCKCRRDGPPTLSLLDCLITQHVSIEIVSLYSTAVSNSSGT